jgi:uncharacterized tellurite resistance protein B-like protein
MSFLDDMEKKKKALTKQKHPLCDEELRLREAYATGVALLMARADELLSNTEKVHLQELADALQLTDDPAERIIATVTDADADIVESIIATLLKQEHKYLFIIDLYRAAYVDGNLQPEEQKMIDLFADILALKPVENDCLKQFAEGMALNDKEKMQDALLEAHHFCMLVHLGILTYFCKDLTPIQESTQRDLQKAQRAARQGIHGAQEFFIELYYDFEKNKDLLLSLDLKELYFWFLQAAESGNAHAMHNIAAMSDRGHNGRLTNNVEAEKWLSMYEDGRIEGESTFSESEKLCRMAADLGDVNAMSALTVKDLIYTDSETGLMWPKDGDIAPKKTTWYEAKEWVSSLNYAGYTDWRLPTKDEVISLFHGISGYLQILHLTNKGIKINHKRCYWEATTSATYVTDPSEYADFFCFGETGLCGDFQAKNKSTYVFPVRG